MQMAHLGRFTYQAFNRRAVAEIRRKVSKRGKRNAVSRLLRAKDDKDAIAAWRSDLNRILLIFNVGSDVYVLSLPLSAACRPNSQ